jgi:phosphatidylglycerophosphatase A
MRLIKKKRIVNEEYRVDFFSIFLSSACYTGFMPAASGTFGSIFGLLFLLIPGFYNPIVLMTLSVIFFFVGIVTSDRMVYRYGDDPSVVVIDEVVGMWISLLIISFGYGGINYLIVIISFLTFRFFDIVKVFPAGYFDRIKSGFGIMMDDAVAGIYSGIVSVIIIKIIMGYINGNG